MLEDNSFVMSRLDTRHGNGITRVDSMRRGGAPAPRSGSRKGGGFKPVNKSNNHHNIPQQPQIQQQNSPSRDKKPIENIDNGGGLLLDKNNNNNTTTPNN